MTEVDLIFNPYLIILLICIIYIFLYAKYGFTNPIAIFYSCIALYVPIKYYFVVLMGLEFASSSIEKFGKSFQLFAISNGGYLILIFLLLSAIFQSIFKVMIKKQKIIGIFIKNPMAIPTVMLSGFIFFLFLLFNPFSALLDGLTFRTFTQTKGMAYLTLVFDTLSLISIYQYLEDSKLAKLSFLMLYLAFFYFLNGRSGPIVLMGLFIFVYLFSVKGFVPTKSILLAGIALFIFALIHGAIRTQGDLILALAFIAEGSQNDIFFMTAFIERISQLEEFSVLSQLISDGKIQIDFLSPLNVFTQFIPRAFWDEKPFFFNTNIMSIVYPEIQSEGVNFAFLGLGEFIYSFGFTFGLILASIVMGFLLSTCDNYLKVTKNNGEVFLFFYFIPYYCLIAGFNDGWLNTAVMQTILINLLTFKALGKFHEMPLKR